jgi:hypothetical protein
MNANAKGKKTSTTIPIILITLDYFIGVKSSSFNLRLLIN